MIRTSVAAFFAASVMFSCSAEKPAKTLKEAFGDKFLIGVAIDTTIAKAVDEKVTSLVTSQFNAVVAENCMKGESIQPKEGEFDFKHADILVDFAEKNNMTVTGHCLIWHSQAPKWFFTDSTGTDVSREVLIERMRKHITATVSRYKGRIKGWDVVNEAIENDGSFRQSKYYKIVGEDFIKIAFQAAHEADPDAELYYNDYGMAHEGRRNAVVNLVKSLKESGCRIDAVGMQGHMGMDNPKFDEFEKSLEAFAATGVKVMITEWDMSALPTIHEGANVSDTVKMREGLNPYPNGLPENVDKEWNARMERVTDLFVKHSDVISRVTAWGLSDNETWRNDWPIKGRKDYPLLFDRDYKAKPFLNKYLNN